MAARSFASTMGEPLCERFVLALSSLQTAFCLRQANRVTGRSTHTSDARETRMLTKTCPGLVVANDLVVRQCRHGQLSQLSGLDGLAHVVADRSIVRDRSNGLSTFSVEPKVGQRRVVGWPSTIGRWERTSVGAASRSDGAEVGERCAGCRGSRRVERREKARSTG